MNDLSVSGYISVYDEALLTSLVFNPQGIG
jgi:hypothetical protein